MLRITPAAGVQRAKDYYTESLNRGDYYTEGQELPGVWGGKLAEQLGLTGEVGRDEFFRLCENRHPESGKPLTPKSVSNRRVGYDVNWHPVKSVSIQYGLHGDPEILAAFEDAVDHAMGAIESDAKARVRRGGADHDRKTGNLVWSRFTHLTTRPVGGVPDMHLHSHAFTFNVTHDPVEQRNKALQLGTVKKEAGFYESLFHSRLRQNLEESGYRTRTTKGGKSFELTEYTDEMISEFSRRTRGIEKLAQEKGIVDDERKSELGARTREKKAQDLTMDELRPLWRSRLTPEQLAVTRRAKADPRPKEWIEQNGCRAADEAIAFAKGHLYERDAVVRERALLETALKHSQGEATLDQVRTSLDRQEFLRKEVDGVDYLTTKELVDEEKKLLAFVRRGAGEWAPFSQREDFTGTDLSPHQAMAARALLGSEDQLSVLRGSAGTGKTTLMRCLVEEIERTNRGSVFVAAPTIDAADMLKGDGFDGAQTVQRLLANKAQHDRLKGGTVWIDEAGLVGTRLMADVFRLADKQNARLILTGDHKQHSSVGRGSVLKLLQGHGSVAPVELTEIRRQKGDYKRAVQAISRGAYGNGFSQLDRLGWVREMETQDAHRAIAEQVRRSVVGKGGSTKTRPLVVSPTHEEKEELTEAIRDELFRARWLSGSERAYRCLVSADLTEEQKRQADSYKPGHVVCFHQNMRGFRAGTRADVQRVDNKGDVWVSGQGGDKRVLDTDQPERFAVYHQVEKKIAVGDPIRITANGRAKNGRSVLRSGAEYEVRGFDGDDIVLDNGWTVDSSFGHWDHAYVKTSVASQGKTAERVLVSQRSASFANNAEQFYVSVSRAKREAIIFTDDKERLAEEIRRTERFKNASDLKCEGADRHQRERNDERYRRREEGRERGV